MDTHHPPLKILSLTTSYPTSVSDYRGRFIHDWALSLQSLGASIRMIGPRCPTVLGGVPYEGFRHYPGLLMGDGAPEVLHERKVWGSMVGAAITVEMARMARSRSQAGDLIVAHWLTPSAFAALAARGNYGCPVHAYVHGSDLAVLEAIPRMVGRRLVRVLDRQLTGISFVSEQLQARFNSLLDRHANASQSILPMGFQRGSPDHRFAAEIRRLSKGRPVISTLGRQVPIKGLSTLAKALKDSPPCLWVAAGDGPEQDDLKTMMANSDELFTPGIISADMREALFAESTLFIQPSLQEGRRQEGTPVAVLEAMSAGVPTILSSTGGMTSIGRSAQSVLCPPGDPTALSGAIRSLLADADLRETMAAAHRDFSQGFEWSHLGPKHLSVLAETARQN